MLKSPNDPLQNLVAHLQTIRGVPRQSTALDPAPHLGGLDARLWPYGPYLVTGGRALNSTHRIKRVFTEAWHAPSGQPEVKRRTEGGGISCLGWLDADGKS